MAKMSGFLCDSGGITIRGRAGAFAKGPSVCRLAYAAVNYLPPTPRASGKLPLLQSMTFCEDDAAPGVRGVLCFDSTSVVSYPIVPYRTSVASLAVCMLDSKFAASSTLKHAQIFCLSDSYMT
ncbi:hypothetical protein KCU89_g96, partial [Aureobasidium melanogenum]